MSKRYQDMTSEELREATKEFDEPTTGPGLPGKPLTREQRAWWKRVQPKLKKAVEARRKVMGRPTIGQGSKMIALSIERGLLAEADRFAKARRLTRAQLVACGLRALLDPDPLRIIRQFSESAKTLKRSA